jgi:hypothetical protein
MTVGGMTGQAQPYGNGTHVHILPNGAYTQPAPDSKNHTHSIAGQDKSKTSPPVD